MHWPQRVHGINSDNCHYLLNQTVQKIDSVHPHLLKQIHRQSNIPKRENKMNKVLMTAVIVLPLVMFLAFFGENIMTNFTDNADAAKGQSDALKSKADGGAW